MGLEGALLVLLQKRNEIIVPAQLLGEGCFSGAAVSDDGDELSHGRIDQEIVMQMGGKLSAFSELAFGLKDAMRVLATTVSKYVEQMAREKESGWKDVR